MTIEIVDFTNDKSSEGVGVTEGQRSTMVSTLPLEPRGK